MQRVNEEKTTSRNLHYEGNSQTENLMECSTKRLHHLKDRNSGNEDKMYNLKNRVNKTENVIRNNEKKFQE